MKPKTFAIIVIAAVACGVLAEYVARGQEYVHRSLQVKWKANKEPDIAGYRVMITSTNIGTWTNVLATNWMWSVGAVTSSPVVVPNQGPWAAHVQAVNLAGIPSLWSTGAVFSIPEQTIGVSVSQTITINIP